LEALDVIVRWREDAAGYVDSADGKFITAKEYSPN
jgi:hypothetical protein